jgi:hypothetical protein
MKKPERTFIVGVGDGVTERSAILGVSERDTLTISLGSGRKVYGAPVAKVFAALSRWHALANPTGKRRHRRLMHSSQLRRLRKNDGQDQL